MNMRFESLTTILIAFFLCQIAWGQTNPEIEVGTHKTILSPDRRSTLEYFPDQPVALLSVNPTRCYMAVGNSTVAFEGRNIGNLKPVKKVLEPGSGNDFDNGYAGAGGVWKKGQQVTVFYHAEDYRNLNRDEYRNVHEFMASVGAAVSSDGGRTFKKVGQILSSKHKKKEGSICGGVGDISICVDKNNEYLLAHYTDFSRFGDDGVQICVARSKLSDGGRPGSWKKYFEGSFSEPGIKGRESHIFSGISQRQDFYSPHVIWCKSVGHYLMVFSVVDYSEVAKGKESIRPTESGIYLTTSRDAIKWEKPQQLFSMHAVIIPNRELAVHPSIHVENSTSSLVNLTVAYGYSPKWGSYENGTLPHHLAARTVKLSFSPESGMTSKTEAPAKPETLGIGHMFPGKFQMTVHDTVENQDLEIDMEFRADNRFEGGGYSGKWKLSGKKLLLTAKGYRAKPGRLKSNGKIEGELTRTQDRRKFTWSLTPKK